MSRFYSVSEVPAKGIPSYLMPFLSARVWFLFLICYFGLHYILRVTLSSFLQVDIATLLGHNVSDPQEQDGVYFVNGKNLAGDASFAKMQLGQGGEISSWKILR